MMRLVLILLFALTHALFSTDSPFVSEYAFKTISDFVLSDIQHEQLDFNPENVFEGAIIYVQVDLLSIFFRDYHPKIGKNYVLITHGKDPSAPGKFASWLKDPKIIAWCCRNPSMSHFKVHPIPIGVNVRTKNHINRFVDVYNLVKDQPCDKEYLLYLNIALHERIPKRKDVYEQFNSLDYCYTSDRKPMEDYLLDLKKSVFVLSPEGRGMDCFRTWESIIMGAIPIVTTSKLDPLFIDLPVLIVKEWEEVNEPLLLRKAAEIGNKSYSLQKLYIDFWKEYIHNIIKKEGIKRNHLIQM